MTNLSDQIANFIGQYWSALVGFLIVAAYARQRFNEPTFPNRETLPPEGRDARATLGGSADTVADAEYRSRYAGGGLVPPRLQEINKADSLGLGF
jgi:hypothetical protein